MRPVRDLAVQVDPIRVEVTLFALVVGVGRIHVRMHKICVPVGDRLHQLVETPPPFPRRRRILRTLHTFVGVEFENRRRAGCVRSAVGSHLIRGCRRQIVVVDD